MNNTNKTSLQKALDNLIKELKKVADEHDENEFGQLLAEQLGPALAEDDQLFGTSVFVFLDVAVQLYQLESDLKKLSVESALDKVTDRHLLEYASCVHDVKRFILDKEPTSNADAGILHKWKQALRSAIDLEDYANLELHQRVGGYSTDIKRLKEDN